MRVFNKKYASSYDSLYHDKDYKKECDFLESIFNKYSCKVKSILDLGCGTGGHALILAKRNYHVTGVDRAATMLTIAQEKSKKNNINIEFIKANITEVKLDQQFDAVISMFAVMGYQTTNEAFSKACKVAKKHLKPGGIFIFDCWNGVAVLRERPEMRIKEIKISDDEKIIRFTQPVIDELNNTVDTRFKLWRIKNGQLTSETNEAHLMRYLFPQEIRYFLQTAGFNKTEFCPFLKFDKKLTPEDWNLTAMSIA